MNLKSRPVLVIFSVLAGLQVLAGGAALGDVVGSRVAGLIVLAVAAAQVGMTFYVQGQVTANVNVAARIDESGTVVAGPATVQADGQPVTVT